MTLENLCCSWNICAVQHYYFPSPAPKTASMATEWDFALGPIFDRCVCV